MTVLSLHHGNSAVRRSLSDNKNTITTDRTDKIILDKIIISVCRMNKYAKSKGGTHNRIVTSGMVQLLGQVKKKNEERLENERKKELPEQQVREAEEKEKEKEEMLKKCDRFKESLEEAEDSYKKRV